MLLEKVWENTLCIKLSELPGRLPLLKHRLLDQPLRLLIAGSVVEPENVNF